MTPNKAYNIKEIDKVGGVDVAESSETPTKRRTKQELRDLWKKAINQQLMLIRMEKENAKLSGKKTLSNCKDKSCYTMRDTIFTIRFKILERQEEATVKRNKLEYDELSSCVHPVEIWDLCVSKESRISTKCDNQMLLHAVKQGNQKQNISKHNILKI